MAESGAKRLLAFKIGGVDGARAGGWRLAGSKRGTHASVWWRAAGSSSRGPAAPSTPAYSGGSTLCECASAADTHTLAMRPAAPRTPRRNPLHVSRPIRTYCWRPRAGAVGLRREARGRGAGEERRE